MKKFLSVKLYIKDNYLIYTGVFLCTVSAFSFHRLLEIVVRGSLIENVLVFIFFIISFFLPILLSIIFTIRCFKQESKSKLLIEIIHSYIGIILIFSSLYFQTIVLSDRINSYRKDFLIKNNIITNSSDNYSSSMNDIRSFQGIDKRLWSSFDHPGKSAISAIKDDSLRWKMQLITSSENISKEDVHFLIQRYAAIKHPVYLKENVLPVYLDCMYFSMVCVSTVGFGDISPKLWYTKMFVMLEIAIGVTLFIFAIGFLFSDFKYVK